MPAAIAGYQGLSLSLSPLGRRHRRQGSRMRPLVKFLPRVKPTTTTPVSTAGGSGFHHHHYSSIITTAAFPGPPSRSTVFGVSPATYLYQRATPGLEITGRVTRDRNPTTTTSLFDPKTHHCVSTRMYYFPCSTNGREPYEKSSALLFHPRILRSIPAIHSIPK